MVSHRFDGAVLGFEAGTIDPFTRTGWTVLVVGRSRFVVGIDTLSGFDDPARAPWHHVPGDSYLVVDVGRLTGHRTTLLRPDGDRR
ncbi:pyridoxamine 5'-phosphate oxidase family protein [Rhodococcus opacus]|uniref:pyridoxamine 5'-phosphate oxidase family protein n=1 Tax=Rhodococcus opacus TaxID=37919 RepID=UPI002F26612E